MPKKEEWPKFMVGEYVEVSWQGHERIAQVMHVDAANQALKVGELDHWFSFAEAKLYRPWKKEELTMEKSCKNCGQPNSESCKTCTYQKHKTFYRDNWIPLLPTKTKNLTWQEAYEAWTAGWEVANPCDNRWLLSFSPDMTWSTYNILSQRYHLTGKRR
jgi:hypothetical protein